MRDLEIYLHFVAGVCQDSGIISANEIDPIDEESGIELEIFSRDREKHLIELGSPFEQFETEFPGQSNVTHPDKKLDDQDLEKLIFLKNLKRPKSLFYIFQLLGLFKFEKT